jgi:hypothetical protein
MLALAVVAGDAKRAAAFVDDDDRVHPIDFARATVVFDRLAGAIRTR